MSGKVRRSRQYDDYLKQQLGRKDVPGAEYLAQWDRLPFKEGEENAFLHALLWGLRLRSGRKSPTDSHVIEEILQLCAKTFLCDAFHHGIVQAGERVSAKLACWTSRDLARLRKPSPVQLLEESAKFERQLSSKHSMAKREQFLLNIGLNKDLALESDADLTEAYLANMNALSRSEVHKLLARAARSVTN